MARECAFPLQQGQLDWLCSVYAIINLKWLHKPDLTYRRAKCLFRKIIRNADKEPDGNVRRLITEGLDPVVEEIEWLGEQVDLTLETVDTSLDAIGRALADGARGVLVFLVSPKGTEKFSHYTLVTEVTSQSLKLCDSEGRTEIRLSGEKMMLDRRRVKISCAFQSARG